MSKDENIAQQELSRMLRYRKQPAQWVVDYCGFRPESLWWSMNEGYGEDFQWDSTIQFPGEKEPRPCPNPLVALLRSWAAGYQQLALQSAANVGKAQPLDEPVQTPSGSTEMGDLEVGDKVIGVDGKPTEVEGVFPQGERAIYKVELQDGTYTYADGEHLWKIETTASRGGHASHKLLTTTQLKQNLDRGMYPRNGYWVPVSDPVEHTEKLLPLDPYVLGVLLGDGSITQNVGLSTSDSFIVDEVEARTPPEVSLKHYQDYDYRLLDSQRTKTNRVKDCLKDLGVFGCRSEEKFIPDLYMRGSKEQRLLLLQGLMDTDGTMSNGGTSSSFTSTSETLLDQVRRLVWSLGGSCTKRESSANDYLGSYSSSVRLPNELSPFRLPRKVDQVEPSGPKGQPKRKVKSVTFDRIAEAQCIQVEADHSMYLTRDYIATHNTYLMAAGVLHYLDTHRPSLVKTYAPTEDTLQDQLFGHIGEFFQGLGDSPGFKSLHPQAEKHNDLNVYMRPESDSRSRWKASGDPVESYSGDQADYGAESAAGAQGAHAEWMTLIIEEAPGVHSSIWNALDMTLGPKNQLIAYGNPDSEQDPLNQFAERDRTLVIRISGFDHPNYVCGEEIIPGAFNPRQPERLEDKFGSRDHPMWKSRIRGICPRTSGECLFKNKALEAVEKRHRKSTGEGRLSDQPWQDPVFEMPHDPERWRSALLGLARSDGWGDEAFAEGKSVEEAAREEALGIYDIEGHTRIYEPPKRDMIGRYALSLDVAGDYAEGDYHAGLMYDRVARHVVAEIHLEGPREAYALQALALAKFYRVPYERDPSVEEEIEEDPQAWCAKRYVEIERDFRKRPDEAEWPGRQQSYPKLAWETNGVGALHKIGPFKGYPNLYYDKNPDIAGGKRSRRMGWQTTGGKSGSRNEMIENLRDWHHLLAYEPTGCPSEGLLDEMKAFKRDKAKGRYEAETGSHDDRVMSLAIALTVSDRLPEPTEAKMPSPERQRAPRSTPDEPAESSSSIWSGAASGSVWGL